MPSGMIGIDAFRAELRKDRKPTASVFRASVGEVKAVAGKPRTFRFCFSDGSVDRMGDTIDPAGWNLHDFNKNPVCLFAHDSSAPPIGRASNLMVEDGRLMGDIEFAPPEVYGFADTIFKLVQGGYLNAVSVGFQPKEYEWADDEDREWGLDFKAQDLLEISVVPVPALPSALIDARAKGIDTTLILEWAEKTLKSAKEPPMRTKKPGGRRRTSDGAASETDPASGGALVGNCGRPLGDSCGMVNVAECSIHGQGEVGTGSEEDEDKNMDAKLRKLVQQELLRTLKSMRRRDPEDGDDPSAAESPDEPLQKCLAHMKAAHMFHKMAMASHKKAMDALSDAIGGDDDNEDGTSKPDGDDDGGEKAILAEIARLRDA